MLRSGMRYFCARSGAVQRGRNYRLYMRYHTSRSLSLHATSGSSYRVFFPLSSYQATRANAAVPRLLPGPLLPYVMGHGSNCSVFARSWSSGRMYEDSKKEVDPLVDGEVTSVCATKIEGSKSSDCEQAIREVLPQLPWRQRVKTFAIEYGRVGICTHIVLSLLSISIIYVGVSNGVDVKAILDWVGFSTSASDSTTNTAGTFVIAYTFYKVLTPVRWPLTFAVTPVVLRALRRRGYMLASINLNNSPSSPPPPPP